MYLAVHVLGDRLSLVLTCTNDGLLPMSFTCALHTYLRVADVAQVALDGLGGQSYWDKTDGLNKVGDAALLVFDGEVDRIYGGVQRDLFNKVMEEQGGYRYLDVSPRTITAQPHRPSYASDGDYFSKPNAEDIIRVVKEMMAE